MRSGSLLLHARISALNGLTERDSSRTGWSSAAGTHVGGQRWPHGVLLLVCTT